MFSHRWKPCDFCTKRNCNVPCIKIFGPRRQARIEPARQLPMPDDSYVAPEDRLLYQYLFTKEFANSEVGFGVQILMRVSAGATGGYVRSSLARHTGLWAAAHALGFESLSVSGHYGQSLQEFHKSLNPVIMDPRFGCRAWYWSLLLYYPSSPGLLYHSPEYLRWLRWFLQPGGVYLSTSFFAELVGCVLCDVVVDGAFINPTAIRHYLSRIASVGSWDTIMRFYKDFLICVDIYSPSWSRLLSS